jgi:hypothetical protein
MHLIIGLSPDSQGSDLVGTVTVRLGVGGQIGPRFKGGAQGAELKLGADLGAPECVDIGRVGADARVLEPLAAAPRPDREWDSDAWGEFLAARPRTGCSC